MSTRRTFLTQTAAAGVAASVPFHIAKAAPTRIKSLVRREETTKRLPWRGMDWYMTWAADDRLYVSGIGVELPVNQKRTYQSRLVAVSGNPNDAQVHDVPGYPELLQPERG